MISWHKVGQKVVLVDCRGWSYCTSARSGAVLQMPSNLPVPDEVLTISKVRLGRDFAVYLHFQESDPTCGFNAKHFAPVYPTIIDQLRKLDAPSPERERVKEGEHV